MTLRKALLAAAVVLSVPVMPALAHDDEANSYNSHDRFHDQLSDAHERAHDEGFYSRGEHRAYHRALRDLHDGYHDNEYGTSYRSYYVPHRSYYYGRPRFSVFWGW